MRTSVLYHTLAVALVVGAACKGPDSPDTNFNLFAAKLRAANVLPKPADTTAAATATVTSHPTDSTFSWTYNAGTVSGTIDSVALYTATSAATITSATAPSVLLCATAACTGSGTTAKVTTYSTVYSSLRGYGQQFVIWTTTTRTTNGAARGVVYPTNP